jgi:hypothetical protein
MDNAGKHLRGLAFCKSGGAPESVSPMIGWPAS